MASVEAVEYLRQQGVQFAVERCLGALLSAKPDDPLEFLAKCFEVQMAEPTALRDRLTESDIANRLARLYPLFIDQPVTLQEGVVYSALPLTDFCPPLHPFSLEEMADCLIHKSGLTNTDVDVIVSLAMRGAGSLAHACAKKLGEKYSLSNWYPDGSFGDTLVEANAGFSGKGHIYLNSITPGMRCLIIDDILRTGNTSRGLVRSVRSAGAIPVMMLFAAEVSNLNGRDAFAKEFPDVPVASLFSFQAVKHGSTTQPDGSCPYSPGSPLPTLPYSKPWMPAFTPDDITRKLRRILEGFVGVTIQQTPQGYPYSNFLLTDFVPLMDVSYVEDCADCCVTLGRKYFDECDIIVSESDRGGGPLTHGCALRTNKPFCLANWYSSGTDMSFGSNASVGYSGEGRIYVNGVRKGTKVVVVDDMLSSGGTAEALFSCIEEAGGIILCGIFASEKENLKGRARLQKKYAHVPVITLCSFISEGAATTAGTQPVFPLDDLCKEHRVQGMG